MNKEKSCGAVVFRKIEGKNQVLLIKHVNGGHWAFPKGHVENNETEEETALREILEETGLAVKLYTEHRKVVTYSPKQNIVKDVVYFVAVADDTEAVAQECEIKRIKWFNIDDAVEHISYENDKKIYLSAVEYYLNNIEKFL